MSDPKQLLADLQRELQGEVIEEVYPIGGRSYTMRLLNEAENSWVYSHLELGSEVGMAMSIRLPQLAAGIRAIDGVTKEELFSGHYELLTDAEKLSLVSGGSMKRALFYNKRMLDFISSWKTEIVQALYSKWVELESRRVNTQNELKNS